MGTPPLQADGAFGEQVGMSRPPPPKLNSPGQMEGMSFPPRPLSPESGPLAPNHANVKRGLRSRGGQSAAAGGRAKRWPERDREPLFHPLVNGRGLRRPSRALEPKSAYRLLSVRGIGVQDFIPSVDDAGHFAKALEPLLEPTLLGKPEHLIP